MKLHNTLVRKTEDFKPLQPGAVTLYSCGPTVYDRIHIGNLSSSIFADTLRRVLESVGNKVQHVMNFTDVDDKTIRRSRETYPDKDPRDALHTLTTQYGDLFLKDAAAVGNDVSVINFVKATDNLLAIQALIRELHEGGFAYIAEDGVYFSIQAYKDSGKTYGQLTEITESSTSTARIQNDEYDKAAAHDFALWKRQKPDEPVWDFELDGQDINGRPGWHIECSAMSRANLNQPFDIHTGGVDLIFPHHENEIAQSTAGKPDPIYARYFAHNEHLLVDGQKMSKSLNNFYTLEDITGKGFDPLAFRLLVLQAHYRKQAHFSWDNLEAAQNRLKAYRAMADLYWQPRPTGGLEEVVLQQHMQAVQTALEDDLDTPAALAALSQLEAAIDNGSISMACQEAFGEALRRLDQLLGLNLRGDDISSDQKALIDTREQARTAQEWGRSDELRDQLQTAGIELRDTADGALWTRRRH